MGLFQVNGLTASNNATNPTTKMDISVKVVTLLNPSTRQIESLVSPPNSIGCSINTVGVSGRDSSAVYTAGQTVWFYLIWSAEDGLNTINSPNDPIVGPIIPAGYTHYCPMFPVVVQSGIVLINPIYVSGNKLLYKNPTSIQSVTNPTPNVTYSQSYASYIPSCAQSYKAEIDVEGSYQSGTYGAQGGFIIQASPGVNYLNISLYVAATSYATNANTVVSDMPLDPSMTFKIIWNLNQGTFNPAAWPNLTVFFLGYEFPYGG